MGLGGQCHALAAFSLGKKPDTLCTADWTDTRSSLDRCGKSRPHQVQFLDHSAPSQSLYQLHQQRYATKVWWKKTGGKRSLGRHRHKWNNNIKLHITDTRCEAVNWVTWLRRVFLWCSQEYGNKLSGFKKGKTISLVPKCLLCSL